MVIQEQFWVWRAKRWPILCQWDLDVVDFWLQAVGPGPLTQGVFSDLEF
jgi:hypothetical protein